MERTKKQGLEGILYLTSTVGLWNSSTFDLQGEDGELRGIGKLLRVKMSVVLGLGTTILRKHLPG